MVELIQPVLRWKERGLLFSFKRLFKCFCLLLPFILISQTFSRFGSRTILWACATGSIAPRSASHASARQHENRVHRYPKLRMRAHEQHSGEHRVRIGNHMHVIKLVHPYLVKTLKALPQLREMIGWLDRNSGAWPCNSLCIPKEVLALRRPSRRRFPAVRWSFSCLPLARITGGVPGGPRPAE